ncbi:MAG: GNAT family N-acetyltransferase [candidate division Zixibacteria bacterium]|nr:GNAT family N-acetyltransferase [candidate division Zixibacteria bacterium]
MRDSMVTILPAEPEDVEMFYRWSSSDERHLFTCRETYPPSKDAFGRFYISEINSNRSRWFKVQRNRGKRMVGKITMFNINPRNRSCELGMFFEKKYRGKGYGKRAVALVAEYMFYQMNMNKIYAQTGAFNEPTVALLESLGFKREGVLRKHHFADGKYYDDYVYGIFESEWGENR